MILYATTITNRLRYIADFIGYGISGTSFILTENLQEYNNYSGFKLNYSHQVIEGTDLQIDPHTLLFENDIREQRITCLNVDHIKFFFATEGDFPFDIFAASFFLMSRYEEYLPYTKDFYGRYAHENSLAYKEDFLHIPLVNEWLLYFKKKLSGITSFQEANDANFTFLPTYDIDEAYSYRYKNLTRTFGGIAKTILKGSWNKVMERYRVLRGQLQDPFDSFEWLDALHHEFNIAPVYFFLVAEKAGKFDKNIPPHHPSMQQLIKRLAAKYPIGIHPSWQSGDDVSLLSKEKQFLSHHSNKTITFSRQHFIRMTLPATYRGLLEAGIQKDFSMGYGSINGFRASVATPFYWYDLEHELITNLLVYPFCYMEANSFYEQKFTPAQALNELRHYLNVVKNVNGTLITIWHNTFLGTAAEFEGWKETYVQFLKEATA